MQDETTLSQLSKDPEVKYKPNLFAVVIDISEAMKNDVIDNFTYRVKLVDPTFNYKVSVTSSRIKFHKYAFVNIYCEDTNNSPRITHVGSVIRLRRFKFKVTPKGELMGTEVKFSNWMVYEGGVDSSMTYLSKKNMPANRDRQMSAYERGRVRDLRVWFASFLLQNSLRYICWWSDWKQPRDSSELMLEEHGKIDIIAKVIRVTKRNECTQLLLMDRENNQFELTSIFDVVEVGELLKLRCFKLTAAKNGGLPRKLEFENLSGCIKIPSESYDGLQFEKQRYLRESRSHGFEARDMPFLRNYSLMPALPLPEGLQCCTALRTLSSVLRPTAVATLKRNFNDLVNNKKKVFLFRGRIRGILDVAPRNVIKWLNVETKKIVPLGHPDVTRHEKKWRVIYDIKLLVSDLHSNNELLVYLVTNHKETHLFSCWDILPNIDDYDEWVNISASTLKKFEKRLSDLVSEELFVDLYLEFGISGKAKPFYSVVNTIFLKWRLH